MSHEILTSKIPEPRPTEEYRKDVEEHQVSVIASTAETSAVCSVQQWAWRPFAPGIRLQRPFRRVCENGRCLRGG